MRTNRFFASLVLIVGVSVLAGCFNRGNSVPNEVTIELPDGTTTTVTLGAGVPSLADSTWDFYITGSANSSPAQSLPFLTITFGSEGELTRFDSNPFSPEIFGDTLYFDGEKHSTNQAGLTYSAGTYGAETSDATGFSFEGRLTGFAAGMPVANATVSASGTFDTDDPDTMTGELSFSVRITVDFIPGGDMDEAYNFIAHKATE